MTIKLIEGKVVVELEENGQTKNTKLISSNTYSDGRSHHFKASTCQMETEVATRCRVQPLVTKLNVLNLWIWLGNKFV